MGWKLSRRTHQRFRHLRVWSATDRSNESCKSKTLIMIPEQKLLSTKTLEPLPINGLDEVTKTKSRNMVQLPIQ